MHVGVRLFLAPLEVDRPSAIRIHERRGGRRTGPASRQGQQGVGRRAKGGMQPPDVIRDTGMHTHCRYAHSTKLNNSKSGQT
jgi:hypothetical protein